MTRDECIGIGQAAGATLCFSTGAILVRWSVALSPVEAAAVRMLLGALFVGIAAWMTGAPFRLSGKDLRRLLPVGIIAALHFLAFIASLHYTTVAHSLTLVYTAPLFIAALSPRFFGEPLPPRCLPGTLLALLGVSVLTGLELHLSRRMLLGDLLALASAVTFALYSLFGRRERDRVPLLAYAGWVYLLAGLVMAPFAGGLLRRGAPLPALAAVVAMALFPLAVGHTLYNASVRRLHPSIPNLIATQEVTGAIVLAWLLLGETPSLAALAGVAITLFGVGLVLAPEGARLRQGSPAR
ncbi:MAG TPA: DMT family transporter [Candidatus Sulfotelmatobacter sp.]|nr:DMT family transporter [Candidatus Sulfotelmatobacter sp.]